MKAAPSKPAQPTPEKKPAQPGQETRISSAEFSAAAAKTEQIPPPALPEIAFAGRSNVGKSSLLNMLLARKGLARTSNTPGRTRQIIFFDVALAGGGPKLSFVDLPGYGYAKVSKSESAAWKQLLEGYLKERATLKVVAVLVDARRGVEQEERDLIEFLETRPDVTVIVVATKLDKVPRSSQKPTLAAIAKAAGVRVIGTSAETRDGREQVWARILENVV